MSNDSGQGSAAGAPADPVIIDLGKKRSKQVKALRKGRPGKLLDKVREAVAALREQGAVAPDAQPIIVVVRERQKTPRWPGL